MRLRRLTFATLAATMAMLAACAPGFPPDFAEAVQATKFQPVGLGEDTVKLAVHDTGHGKPIVLLHGLGASSYTWHKIAPALARNHRLIAIDLKGFGESDKPLDDHYAISDQARLVNDYLARMKLQGVTLIGHSYGGGVALAVAINQMQSGHSRIERLVLIDSIAYRQPMPFFFKVLRTPLVGEFSLSLVPPEVQTARALSIAYYQAGKITREAVSNYASALYSEGGRHALLATINNLDPEQADAFSKHYRELKLPALLLWCEHDKIVPLQYGEKLAHDLPDAHIKIIEDCGHIPHEEQPAETLAALQSFLPH
jgi:pimeloyl-ACP methyl ester carboxylesterase